MLWVFIRHAHRDTSQRELDNGLSKKGMKQARALGRQFKKRFGKSPGKIRLVSSPKRRCIETIEPISKLTRQKIEISDLILEEQPGETQATLKKRVTRFLREFEGSTPVVLCSHGDWMPLALEELCGAHADLKKGSWAEIHDGVLLSILQPDDLE